VAILLPVSFLVTSLTWEGRILPADQISARYLNPQLRYYYFRFLKTNGRHVGILLSVSIFTFALPSPCHSASGYKISSTSNHPRHSYDVIGLSIFIEMAAVRHIEFSQGNCTPPANEDLSLVLKFRLDRICSFGDIVIFMSSVFGLKLPVYVVVSAAHAQKGLCTSGGRNQPHILICRG